MTKTKTCPNQNTIQKDGPPRKTQFIKFRVTQEEKRELEIMCEILHVNMSPCFVAAYAPTPSGKPLLSPAAEKMH